MQSCWYYLTLAYFPLPWQILETQLNHKKKEEGRILVTCSLMEQKPTPEGGKPGHQPHGQSQGVGCLSCKKGRSHTGSQHSPPQPCTAHPLQEGTEHYLKARKASDEQTFITECTSAKTKIHASFWCWHGEGNVNALQYSWECLGNPMDRGVRWAYWLKNNNKDIFMS